MRIKTSKIFKLGRNNLHSVLRPIISLAITAAVCFAAFTSGANAASYVTTGRVSTGTLNVRASYSSTSAIAGKLYYGQTVTITSAYGGWYAISYNGATKWVSASYITGVSTGGIASSKAATAVAAAEKAIGVPYVYGGASTTGMDCSGLTMYAYAKAGITLPHSASKQASMGTAVSKASLMPGDLVFFDTAGTHSTINHVGIYIGGGLFVEASSGTAKAVVMADLSSGYWSNVFMTARRVI